MSSSASNDDLVLSIDGWGDIGPILSDASPSTNSHATSSFMDNPYACYDYEHETATTTTAETTAQEAYNNEEVSRVLSDLKKYIELLPHTSSSLNALLDAEHNSNDEKAWSLLQYYKERPQLVDYTLEKELPRMEYTWIDPKSGEFIQDKSRVAELLWEASLSEDLHLLPRCANQSLLADLLQFLTTESDNSLIRTHFHMAVKTRKVDITIMPSNGTVLAKAALDMSLPHPSQSMVNIATVNVSAQFSPVQSPPLFHYHVESVELIQPVPSDAELREMAVFLQDLPSFLIEEEDSVSGESFQSGRRDKRSSTAKSFDKRRDAFLQKTQTAWKNVNSGLQQTLLRLSSNSSTNSTTHRSRANSDFQQTQELQPKEVTTTTETAPKPSQFEQNEQQVDDTSSSELSKEQKTLPTIVPLVSTPQQREPMAEWNANEAFSPNDGTASHNRKTPNLQKSLQRIRDAQKASWKKQVNRFKSAAAANSFRSAPPASQGVDQKNSAVNRASDRPSMLEQAASRLRLPRNDGVHDNNSKQTQGKSTQPQQQPRNDEEGGPKKWNSMLQSRLMRLSASKNSSSATSASIQKVAVAEEDGEWVFTSDVESDLDDSTRDHSTTAPPSDDDSASTARSAVSSINTPSLSGSFASSSTSSVRTPAKTQHSSNSSNNSGNSGSLLFQGSDVWGNRGSARGSNSKQPVNNTARNITPLVSSSASPKENNSRQGAPTVATTESPNPSRRKWPSVRPPRRFPQAILKFVPNNNNKPPQSSVTAAPPSEDSTL